MALVLLALMATALPLTTLAVCVAIVSKRRPAGISTAVPVVVAGVVVLWILAVIGLEVHGVAGVAPNDSATKATVLALALSETLNCAAIFVLIGLPLLVPAYFIDRRLRRPSVRRE